MKKFSFFLIISLLLTCHAMVQAQSFYQDNDYSDGAKVSFKGKRPTIVDFVTTEENMWDEHPEFLGDAYDAWMNYLRGRKCKADEQLTVDIANGYVRYEQHYAYDDEEGFGVKEFCVWNCSDGRHKLIAANVSFYHNGAYFDGQYNGITFYLYDSQRRKMKHLSNNLSVFDLDWMMDGPGPVEFVLPRKGKNIVMRVHGDGEVFVKELKWNGMTFEAPDKRPY